MEAFRSSLPEGKVVNCLEDLGVFTVKELKSVLKRYNERTSGVKADLVLRAFAIFCRAKNFSDGGSDSRDDSILYCCEKEWTYDAVNEQCKHLPWTEDLRGTPDFRKFKHIALKSTAYKKLKAFQFKSDVLCKFEKN